MPRPLFDVEAVLASDLIALAEHGASIGAVCKLRRVARSDIGASTGLDAVVTGEFVDVEQDGVVENKALRVFVGNLRLIDADRIWPADDLSNRLEDVGDTAGCGDERIAILRTANGNTAHQRST